MQKRTVTDMEGVRVVAIMLLDQPIGDTPYSPVIVTHPFTNAGVTVIRDSKTGGFQMVNIVEDPDAFKKWKAMMRQRIDMADTPFSIFFMLHHAYALTFLKYAGEYMSDQDFAKILGDAWVSAENANSDVEVSVEEELEMFRRAPRRYLMTSSERKTFSALPEEITVYRGLESTFEHELQAMSWSTDIETARFFSTRFQREGEKPSGSIYEAKIKKKYVLAFFDRCDESEVIVDPAYLTDIHKVN